MSFIVFCTAYCREVFNVHLLHVYSDSVKVPHTNSMSREQGELKQNSSPAVVIHRKVACCPGLWKFSQHQTLANQ